jgi:hypothetical protein
MTSGFNIALGVDASEHGLVVVRGVRAGREVRLDAATESLPAAAGEGAVASALPAYEGFVRRVVAPFPSVSKAQKVFASVLDIQLPFPIERCAYAFLEPREIDGEVEALAVAARQEDVAARLEKLRAAGIDPTHLDVEPLALWTQSVDEAPLDAATPRVVFYIGHDRATLAFGRGSRCTGGHAMRSGARQVFEGGGLAPLAVRVRQLIKAQWKDEAEGPMQWAFCGPALADAARAEALKAALDLPSAAQVFVHKQPSSFLARALAVRALRRGPYRVNLRQGAHVHPRMAMVKDQAHRNAALVALAAGLVLCIVNLGWRGALAARKDAMQARLTASAVDLSGMAQIPKGQELVIAGRAAADNRAALRPLLAVLEPGPADRLASVLARAEGSLSLDAATFSGEAVVLSGRASTWEAVEAASEPLRASGWTVSLDRGDAGPDGRLPFTLKAVP